jgi:hypothetical protein
MKREKLKRENKKKRKRRKGHSFPISGAAGDPVLGSLPREGN